jgi:fucose 4-O-acetylase-like acetyltransferase
MMQRIPLLDYARVFTAFLVILGHLLPTSPVSPLRVYIYQFHMPLFFLISGMLDKHIDFKEYLKKNVLLLLLPIITFTLLFFSVNVVRSGLANSIEILLNSISAFFTSNVILINPTLWFLIALFNAKLLSVLFVKIGVVPSAIIWLALLVGTFHFNPLFFASTTMIMPIYMLGYCFKKQILALSEYKWFKFVWIIGFLLVAIIMYYNGRVSTNRAWYGNGEVGLQPLRIFLFYLSSLNGTFAIISLSSVFKRGGAWLKLTAESLITMMCIQYLFINVFNSFIGSFSILGKFVEALVVMIACVISHFLITKYTPFMIGRLFKKK